MPHNVPTGRDGEPCEHNSELSHTSHGTVRRTALGFLPYRTVRRKKKKLTNPNLTEANIFSYGELSHSEVSYGEESAYDAEQR